MNSPNDGQVTAPKPASSKLKLNITEAFLTMLAATKPTEERIQFSIPKLPPGVVPKGAKMALDQSIDMMNFLNTTPGFCGMGFPGFTYLSELSQRSEYRAPAETYAYETTRTWITLTGADDEKLKELNQEIEKFKIRDLLRNASLIDGFFGRSQIYLGIKKQSGDKARMLPLLIEPESIRKDSLEMLKIIEPVWTTPYMYNATDPLQPDFYVPEAWYVLGKRTHASRLLTFVSHPLPDIVKPAYNFSGMSLTQLIEPYVKRWLKTVDSVNRLISNYSVACIQTNMEANLAGDADDNLIKRAQLLNMMKDNRGVLMLDKDSENFFQINTPLSGLSDLQAQAQEHMAAPTHIPLVKLTGITPSGLNASSEGELKVWYDYCEAYRQAFYNDHLTTLLKVLQLNLWGAIDKNITFHWEPLDTPSKKELSEMRFKDAQADSIYLTDTNPVVSPEEVRAKLRNSSASGYNQLTGAAPEPKKEPAPMGAGPAGGNKPKPKE
jgi:phage-related protein (TIGR01555 family)